MYKRQAQYAANGSQAALLLRQAQAEATPFGLLLFSADAPDPAAVIDQLQQGPAASQPYILLMAYDWSDAAPIAQLLPEAIFLPRPFFLSSFTDALLHLQPEGTRGVPTADDRRQALTGCHILVAEDNDLNAEILIELLQMNGLTVTRANNGQRTVDAFAQAPPGTFDAILMDIQMPVQNGYDATRAIRALPANDAGTIPILAMTANAFTDDVQKSLACGMNGHIAKPIDVDLLFDTLADCLQNNA